MTLNAKLIAKFKVTWEVINLSGEEQQKQQQNIARTWCNLYFKLDNESKVHFGRNRRSESYIFIISVWYLSQIFFRMQN